MIEWCKVKNNKSITTNADNLLYIKQSNIIFSKMIIEDFKDGNSQKQIRIKFGVNKNKLVFCITSTEGYKMSSIPHLSVSKGLRSWFDEYNIENGLYEAEWNEEGYYECKRIGDA